MLNAFITILPLNIKVIITIEGNCHVIGISNVPISLLVKGIEKKTGINVEIIIIWRLINTSISLLTFSIY